MKKLSVKICGLTNIEDASKVVELGANYLGFIFARSPRQVTVKQVKEIISQLAVNFPEKKYKTVGVFVNETNQNIELILKETSIDIAQIHGDEVPQEISLLPVDWYKALRIGSREDIQSFNQWDCSLLLVDTAVKGVYGGTGKVMDADIARASKLAIHTLGKKFILAGGINHDNVFEILLNINPDGIDLGSGVEESVGKKSFKKLEKLFEQVNRYKSESCYG